MQICDIDRIKNNDYIVLLPKKDLDIKESVEYSFRNVFYLDHELNKKDAQYLIDFINTHDNNLIIFDYDEFYRLILPYIKKSKNIKWAYKSNLSCMTNGWVRAVYTNIMEFYDRNIIDEIICLDYSTYTVLKHSGYRTKYVKLDINSEIKKSKQSNSIGLLGDDSNPNHNTYNQLSALKLVDYSYIKILKTMEATKHFLKFFNIEEKEVYTQDEVISNNDINLYCNFTFNNYQVILKSMDMGIPCLVGNTDFFNDNKVLKKYLVLDSDDDINEIATRIKQVRENKQEILKEYEIFRKKYSSDSKELINKLK